MNSSSKLSNDKNTAPSVLTSIIQKRRLMLFGHLIRMDESADGRRILTAVPQSDWSRPVGRPHSSWMATLKNDLSLYNLTFEDTIEIALDKPLWGLLAASKGIKGGQSRRFASFALRSSTREERRLKEPRRRSLKTKQ